MNTRVVPPEQREDDDLVQLCLELYSRTFAYPDSEELHNSAFAAIKVLKDRLRALRAAPAVPAAAALLKAARYAWEHSSWDWEAIEIGITEHPEEFGFAAPMSEDRRMREILKRCAARIKADDDELDRQLLCNIRALLEDQP